MLEAFHIRCLQSILGIRWWHRKTHMETRNTASIESIEHLVLQRQLRWLGHVIRMPSNRLPRRLLYGELLIGHRPVGRPKLRYSDHIKSVLRKCDIPEADLEQLAADRDSWRSTCATGLESFAAASEQAPSDRRTRRHAIAQATRVGPACPQCVESAPQTSVCAVIYRPPKTAKTVPLQYTSSSTSTDYHKQASKCCTTRYNKNSTADPQQVTYGELYNTLRCEDVVQLVVRLVVDQVHNESK